MDADSQCARCRQVAAHLEGRALDAGHLAGRVLEHLGGEAAPVAELEVHALEHRRPVLRFGAARARLDVDEAIVRIERVGEHAPELERGDFLLQLLGIGRNGSVSSSLSAREVESSRASASPPVTRQRVHHAFERFLFLAELLGALRIAPDLRVAQERFDFGQPSLLAFEVKDTSAARPTSPAGR